MIDARAEPTPHIVEPTKLISQANAQRLLAQLEHYEFLSYDQWERIVTLWFVNLEVRKKTLDLLRWARVGRVKFDEESDPDEPNYITALPVEEAEADLGDPVYAVPGLADHLKNLTLNQLGAGLDELRSTGMWLDVQGARASMFHAPPLDAQDLHEGAFIRGAKPGKPISVTGNPGDGKTHFLMCYLAAPALKAGWVVVSNVRIANAPVNYVYVTTFAQAISAAIKARLAGHRVMLIRDEGGKNRSRADATSREGRNQKQVALRLYRKLDIVEVYVNQLARDTPHEVAATRSHAFHKTSQDAVECWTPTLRGTVRGLQSVEALEAGQRPFVRYDTRDPSPFDVTADIISIVDYEYGRREASWEEHMAAIMARLDRIGSSALVDDPLTLEQLRRVVLQDHIDDVRQSPKTFYRRYRKDWPTHGISNVKALWSLMRDEWKMWSHPEDILKACGYCLGHNPKLRIQAAEVVAARPAEAPSDIEG